MDLEQALEGVNVAEALDQEKRDKIATSLVTLVERDEQSRKPWLDKNEEYLKMALQVAEKKSWPWPNAANVKFPLLTIASLQFQARAMPAILGDGKKLVQGKVVGYDPAGIKAEKAERIGKHMSFQLLEKISNWEEDMDRLLLILPLCGTAFKKVYFNDHKQEITIDLVQPDDIIVNYWAKSLTEARRVTQRFYLYNNELISRQRDGKYVDEEIPLPGSNAESNTKNTLQGKTPVDNDPKDTPHEMYEVHTYWDMDDDGYEEPWIFTIEKESRKLLRAVPNFDIESIRKNGKGEVVEIKAKEYFVKYGFIPSPDGGFYDVGFGILLGSLNETASTTINQLLDAGTMATTGGGLLGKGIKLKGGHVSFQPNEWKQIQFTGDDIKKHVFPLPVREPSSVLLNLLQMITASGKEIISISEISTGKLPGQNTPATTTLSSIEEGLKLFNSIYKRIYRAEKRELQLLFKLNGKYLEDVEYFNILDLKEGQNFTGQVNRAEDYNDKSLDVIPTADPNTLSDAVRLLKAQQLIELIPLGAVNPAAAGQRVLQAMDQPNPQELLPQPQPDPKAQAIQMKSQMDMQKGQMDMQNKQQDAQLKLQVEMLKAKISLMEKQMDLAMKQEELRLKNYETVVDLQNSQMRHKQEASQQKEKHALNMMSEADKMNMRRKQNEMTMKSSGGAKKSGNKSRGLS